MFGALRRTERLGPAVADPVRPSEAAHLVLCRLRLVLRQVGTPGIEPFVGWQKLGPIACEAGEEVLARPRPQVEQVRPDAAGPGRARGLDDAGELIRVVGEAGEDGSHADAGAVPGSVLRQTSSSRGPVPRSSRRSTSAMFGLTRIDVP